MAALRTRLAAALGACALVALVLVVLSPRTHRASANPLTGIASVSAGEVHTCAVTTAGGVKCWGFNAIGELGDGTMMSRSAPVDVFGLSSGVASVVANGDTSCAVTTAGGVLCWGENFGITPSAVPGLGSGVTSLGLGPAHACALTSAGAVKCFGSEYNLPSPLGPIAGVTSGVASIDVGQSHTCVIMAAGGVKCFGQNFDGELGDGTLLDSIYAAVDVVGLGATPVAIAAGSYASCALMPAGGVKCWGLGFGLAPIDVPGLTSSVTAISFQGFHICGKLTGGAVRCRGQNTFGQLGDGTTIDRTVAVSVIGLNAGASAVSAGVYHTCALTTAGGVKCWGLNSNGQLGDGTTTDRLVPFTVVMSTVKPTPTSTPCPPAGCPTPTPTATPPPHTGIDFSIGVDTDGNGVDDCNSSGGPAKCAPSAGSTFTLKVYLNSLPASFPGYDGLDIYVTYTGLSSSDNASNQAWPPCAFAAHLFQTGSLRWACAIGPAVPLSTYVGVIGTNDFNCGAPGTITLHHGSGDTDLYNFDLGQFFFEPQGTSETLTINCPTPTPTRSPTATSTPHPPPLGGVARYPAVSSGHGPGLLALLAAATALIALAVAGARRLSRR